MNWEKLGKKLFLYDRVTQWALKKHWKNWDQAKNYCLALGFGGTMGAVFLYGFVMALNPFNFWLLKYAYNFLAGAPIIWLFWLSMITCVRLAPFTSIVPYGKPCKVSLDDRIWIRMLVYWRKNIRHLSEYELVKSFSKHHNNQHPRAQATERQYALKVIFGY